MKIADVRKTAFAMPLTNPAFPRGPYRFYDREFLVITYRTDPEALAAVVPEPLEFDEPIVKFEFIRMPDSTGFGDFTESGQLIPVRYGAEKRRLCPRDVSRRWRPDLRRPRTLGLPQETRQSENHA
jgi:acetoacetate decarboxylase